MAAIKRFFEKRMMDVKFKKAGTGHKLTEDTKSAGPSSSGTQRTTIQPRAAPTGESQMAAVAAVQRMNSKDGSKGGQAATAGSSALKAQVRSEIEAEKKNREKAMATAKVYSPPSELQLVGAPMLAVTGVYYSCPIAGPEILPRKEMEEHIETFMWSQLVAEPEMTSALMIHTLNKNPEKSKICMETLSKYLDNVINNPNEEKYWKIRVNNKAFQERVACLKGTQEFLQSVGFERKCLPGPNEVEEDFLVMKSDHAANTDRLKMMKEVLFASEAIKPQLDRSLKVYFPCPQAHHMEVPPEFYNITPEEIKKEQQIRTEAVERLGMLRTKEMRERERVRQLRRYRYCLIRVRFPDGIILQGTFKANEKCEAIFDFVRENLHLEWVPFSLSTATGIKLPTDGTSLAENDLAPAAIIMFGYDQNILKEIAAQKGSADIKQHLNDQCMSCIQRL